MTSSFNSTSTRIPATTRSTVVYLYYVDSPTCRYVDYVVSARIFLVYVQVFIVQ